MYDVDIGMICFQAKEADFLVQNKAMYDNKEQLSQVNSVSFLVACCYEMCLVNLV